MQALIAGLILFFGLHSVAIVAPYWRERMLLFVGTGTWKTVYALFSGIGFVLILVGFGHARQAPVVLYVPPGWFRYVSFALLLPVFPLLLAAYLPGAIQAKAKHPMLAAVKLWATAHLLAIGTLPDVLLFGSFLLWAIIDRISVKRRVTTLPTRARVRAWCYNDVIAIVLGIALYAWFLLRLHAMLIGVSPLTPPF
ncbi:MAG TPA: NnrU family protein [Steroidobacteraceae bacterium]